MPASNQKDTKRHVGFGVVAVETKSTIPRGIEIVGHLSCHHSCGLRKSELVLDVMLDARDNRRRRL